MSAAAEGRSEFVRDIVDELENRGYLDAGMLARVARMRAALRALDRDLDVLQRFFSPPPEFEPSSEVG